MIRPTARHMLQAQFRCCVLIIQLIFVAAGVAVVVRRVARLVARRVTSRAAGPAAAHLSPYTVK